MPKLSIEQRLKIEILDEIRDYEAKILRLKRILQFIDNPPSEPNTLSNTARNVDDLMRAAIRSINLKREVEKHTFENIILQILNDDVPKTSRQLLISYIELTGREIEMTQFSSRLIGLQQKGTLKKYIKAGMIKVNGERKFSIKHYYGKPEWFTENRLQKQYLMKINMPQ